MAFTYIDQNTYLRIIHDAAKNDGCVIFDSKGYSPFEIRMSSEFAKKAWAEEVGLASKNGINEDQIIAWLKR